MKDNMDSPGDTGSGKTTTAGMLTLGVSLTYGKRGPVAMMDTESASDFLLPIFKTEGVKLLTLKSRAFSDLLTVLQEAEQAGCAALIVDSITHCWTELQESYCRKREFPSRSFNTGGSSSKHGASGPPAFYLLHSTS